MMRWDYLQCFLAGAMAGAPVLVFFMLWIEPKALHYVECGVERLARWRKRGEP